MPASRLRRGAEHGEELTDRVTLPFLSLLGRARFLRLEFPSHFLNEFREGARALLDA